MDGIHKSQCREPTKVSVESTATTCIAAVLARRIYYPTYASLNYSPQAYAWHVHNPRYIDPIPVSRCPSLLAYAPNYLDTYRSVQTAVLADHNKRLEEALPCYLLCNKPVPLDQVRVVERWGEGRVRGRPGSVGEERGRVEGGGEMGEGQRGKAEGERGRKMQKGWTQ